MNDQWLFLAIISAFCALFLGIAWAVHWRILHRRKRRPTPRRRRTAKRGKGKPVRGSRKKRKRRK